MCFSISIRRDKGDFEVEYANETIYLKTNGSSHIVAEFLINTKENTKSFNIIYPNIGVKATDESSKFPEFKGYNKEPEKYVYKSPMGENYEGELRKYFIFQVYTKKESSFANYYLENPPMHFSIFTILFEEEIPKESRVWIRIGFNSPKASIISTSWLQSRYLSGTISGPWNVMRAFERRFIRTVEDFRENEGFYISQWGQVNQTKVLEATDTIKNLFIEKTLTKIYKNCKEWYITLIPHPGIRDFNIIDPPQNLIEISDIRREEETWPKFEEDPDISNIRYIISGLFYGDRSQKISFRYNFQGAESERKREDNRQKKINFSFDYSGSFSLPYLRIIAILTAIRAFSPPIWLKIQPILEIVFYILLAYYFVKYLPKLVEYLPERKK